VFNFDPGVLCAGKPRHWSECDRIVHTFPGFGFVPVQVIDPGPSVALADVFDHGMACAKCSFYQPKDLTAASLLEGKNNLLRMRQEIPLDESEIAALEDGTSALESLLGRLANVPTPVDPTPLELRGEPLVQIQIQANED
jgi:hypothetical protein